MDRISARYKDDPQARVKAQQELWAKHNYNPMGGCLLMFIQLPIFIGLYRALSVDVDLREAPLIPGLHWCSNLAAPDMFISWRNWFWPQWFLNGEGMFALGPYINILPLVTVVLFLVQQKMFMPPPADEQQEMMQRMMKYMMIFMSFLFFKVAAGLCLYFIASSLWGMAERKLIPKPNIGGAGATAMASTPPSNSPTRKKSTPKPLPKPTKGAKRKR
jgi:YidC/Oxa1 family membrane protein insertase